MEGSQSYIAVDLGDLSMGMLLDRPLYVYLPKNNRYVLLARAKYPLEERVLATLKKAGRAYSTLEPLGRRLPEVSTAAQKVRQLCDDPALASFEKSRLILEQTRWLVSELFDSLLAHEPTAKTRTEGVVFFLHRAFGVPRPETLCFVSDLSLEVYERALLQSAVSGVVALWLGYTSTGFIQQFVQSVFCEAVGDNAGASAVMLEEGRVPGVPGLDRRFGDRLRKDTLGEDEIIDIAELAAAIVAGSVEFTAPGPRVALKLAARLGIDAAADGRKAAA